MLNLYLKLDLNYINLILELKFIMKNIPFGKPLIGKVEKKEIQNVLEGPILTHGPKCLEFEKQFAQYIGVKYAITTSNCTTAIHLSLESLDLKRKMKLSFQL